MGGWANQNREREKQEQKALETDRERETERETVHGQLKMTQVTRVKKRKASSSRIKYDRDTARAKKREKAFTGESRT